MWDRLTVEARAVMDTALTEADELGHGYLGDEHILLGLLGHPQTPAAAVLREAGLDLAGARTVLARLAVDGLIPRGRVDDAAALRTVGIDVEQVRERLSAAFGAEAVAAAVWRASRRPWWRGGGRRRTPLCGRPLFAKRALALAAAHADTTGQPAVDRSICCTGCSATQPTRTAPAWAAVAGAISVNWAGPSARSTPPPRC